MAPARARTSRTKNARRSTNCLHPALIRVDAKAEISFQIAAYLSAECAVVKTFGSFGGDGTAAIASKLKYIVLHVVVAIVVVVVVVFVRSIFRVPLPLRKTMPSYCIDIRGQHPAD